MRHTLPVFASALLFASAASADEPLRGDPIQGQSLYRMECAACHGPDGRGAPAWKQAHPTPALPNLGDSAFLATRTDEELHAALATGHGKDRWIPGHAFSNLTALHRWDIVQWLRGRTLKVEEFFPQAVKFTAKDFEIDKYGVERLEALRLQTDGTSRNVVVLAAYKGARKGAEAASLVPWNPVDLDLLRTDDRLGFLSFTDLVVPQVGETIHVGMAFGADGKLQRVLVRHPDAAKRAAYEQILSHFVGQGSKTATAYQAPRTLRDGAAWAQQVTRAASLSAEAILMYDKAERARTAFDR